MPKGNSKQWTLMFYFAVDNELDQFAIESLDNMKKVGSAGGVNVIVQVDRSGLGNSTERYFLRPMGESTVVGDIIERLPKQNIGVAQVLSDFISWGIDKFPAEHFMAVVYGHGQGFDDDLDCVNQAIEDLVKSRSHLDNLFLLGLEGSTPQDFLNNQELQKELSKVAVKLKRKLDIFGMISCMMNMAEVCYQVRNSVSIVIGSEENVPRDGWPYENILLNLVKQPSISPEEVATMIVDEYAAFYRKQNKVVTLSACDLAKSEELAEAVSQLGSALQGGLSNPVILARILLARHNSRSYSIKDYIDLFDFCEGLSKEKADVMESIQAACEAVKELLEKKRFVLHSAHTEDLADPGSLSGSSHGLAIYFPSIALCYSSDLDFPEKTQWQEFLIEYLDKALLTDWTKIKDILVNENAGTMGGPENININSFALRIKANKEKLEMSDRKHDDLSPKTGDLSPKTGDLNAAAAKVAEGIADLLHTALSTALGTDKPIPSAPRRGVVIDQDLVLEVRISPTGEVTAHRK